MIFSAILLSLFATAFGRMAYFLPGGVEYGRQEDFRREFSCQDHSFGFYADLSNNCELYHLCEPVWDDEGNFMEIAQYSFACGGGTVFSQKELACNHARLATPCEDAPDYYESSNIGSGIQLVARNEVRAIERSELDEDDIDDE